MEKAGKRQTENEQEKREPKSKLKEVVEGKAMSGCPHAERVTYEAVLGPLYCGPTDRTERRRRGTAGTEIR